MRIIYIGEIHDNPAVHRLQRDIVAALAARFPGKLALGMEMFTPTQQPALDLWVNGELSEKEFLRRSGWFDQWRMDFGYYRDILIAARDHGVRLVGLNAEKEQVRTVGRSSLEELPAEELAQLPEFDFSDPYQRAVLEAIYSGHDGGQAMQAGFLRVQTLWDETMAANIASFLMQPKHRGHKMVVIAGGNHVRYGFGIPRRVFRRLPAAYTIIGSHVTNLDSLPAEKREQKIMDVDLPDLPMRPYDFVAALPYGDLESTGVKLGIAIAEKNDRVVATKVFPSTPAQEAGMLNDDAILSFGAEQIKDKVDLLYTLRQTSPGTTVPMEILRDGIPLQLEVTFPAAPTD